MVSQSTQARIDALKAEIDNLERTAYREDLVTGIKKGVKDDDLYPLAKAFCNHLERQRKIANLEEARKAKAQDKSSAPVS